MFQQVDTTLGRVPIVFQNKPLCSTGTQTLFRNKHHNALTCKNTRNMFLATSVPEIAQSTPAPRVGQRMQLHVIGV